MPCLMRLVKEVTYFKKNYLPKDDLPNEMMIKVIRYKKKLLS
jgi:hypothetical protein